MTRRHRRRTEALAFLLLQTILAQAANKPEESIKISVQEEGSRHGVPSKIVLLKGASEKIPVSETDRSGILALSHDCALGERFYAEPKDASFFQSNEAACTKEMTLLVARRETPLGILVRRQARTVVIQFKDGSKATYLVSASSRVRNQATLESAPRIPGNVGLIDEVQCRVLSTGGVEQSITKISDSGGLSARSTISKQSAAPEQQLVRKFRGSCSPGLSTYSSLPLQQKLNGQLGALAFEGSELAAKKAVTDLLPDTDRISVANVPVLPKNDKM